MFFNKFPKLVYDLEANGKLQLVTDLFKHVDVNDKLSTDLASYVYEYVKEGERPDQMSQRLYGRPDYYWTFFIINDSLKGGIKEWPKNQLEITNEQKLEYEEYGALQFAPTTKNDTEVYQAYEEFQSRTRNNFLNSELVGEPQDTPDGLYNRIINNLNNIDLTPSFLYVKRNNAYAKVLKFDNNLNQMIVHKFLKGVHGGTPNAVHDYVMLGENHPTTLNNLKQQEQELDAKKQFFGIDQYEGIEDYYDNGLVSFEFLTNVWNLEKALWVKDLMDAIQDNFQYRGKIENDKQLPKGLFNSFVKDKLAQGYSDNEGIIYAAKRMWSLRSAYNVKNGKGNAEIIKTLAEISLQLDGEEQISESAHYPYVNGYRTVYTVTPRNTYYNLGEAPAEYIDEEGNSVSAYNAQNAIPAESGITVGTNPSYFKSYYEKLDEVNETNRQIIAVRPEFIKQFSDEYAKLINK